jgi:hypothetical protein
MAAATKPARYSPPQRRPTTSCSGTLAGSAIIWTSPAGYTPGRLRKDAGLRGATAEKLAEASALTGGAPCV